VAANPSPSVKANGQLDFTDPATVMQLTKTLLWLDFALQLDLPDDRLCPPVPNRHNYILWLKGLLDSSTYEEPVTARKLSGLDVGTGASCIYPLLGCAQRPWFFVGTDIDGKSLSYAKKNVALNNLQNRIRVLARRPDDSLLPLDDLDVESIDFVMTNPPFYESEQEMAKSAEKKSRPPNSACTGAPVEMVCEGGEVAFVRRIISESLVLRERVQWYTSMLGKLSSLEHLVDTLREKEIDNYAVTEFVQGNKTKRWALAWSFGPMRAAQNAARGMKGLTWKKILPPITDCEVLTTKEVGSSTSVPNIDVVVAPLELISWVWNKQAMTGTGRAGHNVWSRAWRRKKMRENDERGANQSRKEKEHIQEERCVFGFTITVTVAIAETTTTCRWVEGHDESIFQSFCGFLRTQMQSAGNK
jgi:23S rRNA (adenine1618-N6)-methyltransferase